MPLRRKSGTMAYLGSDSGFMSAGASSMKEAEASPRSRSRSRSPLARTRTPETEAKEAAAAAMKSEESAAEAVAADSYSASLRLASLETLTGKQGGPGPAASLAGLPFPFSPLPLPAQPTSAKVPSDPAPPASLQEALANLQKTAAAGAPPVPGFPGAAAVPGFPLGQLLAGPGLPKPADLIQQAQTLQLLAHLQTMLMNPAPATSAPSPAQQQLNNAANFQKVGFIHIYEELHNI